MLLLLTGGHIHDSQAARPLLERPELAGVNAIADKAYGAKSLRDYIYDKNGSYTIRRKLTPRENGIVITTFSVNDI